MILQRLPQPELSMQRSTPAFFPDHFLFTEHIHYNYHYPEHKAALGIVTTIKGDGTFHLNDEQKRIGDKCFLLVNKGSQFSVDEMKAGTQPAFLFFHSDLTKTFDFSFLERQHTSSSISENMALLARLGNSCSSFASLKADIIIRNILEELSIKNSNTVNASRRLSATKPSTRMELAKRLSIVKEWLENNFASPISLNDMAAMAMMNSQHFLRRFKQYYQITPHQFLIQLRLDHAKKLLVHTDQTISSICNSCGFESLSSFSGLFKQRFGVSPSGFATETQRARK